jgi:O-acetyl-ADP-ribose deacetylase (regulator of RNase III)
MISTPNAPNKFIYHKGNVINAALSGKYDMFAQGCNCLNEMGAGVALQVKKRIPTMYLADRDFRINSEDRLGMMSHVYDSNNTLLCNLYTQYHWDARRGRNFNYGALISSFTYAIETLDDIREEYHPVVKVCMPRIGGGLARGDWKIIEEMLTYHEFDRTVEFHVYDYDPVVVG